jgi:hypothetical protein
VRYGFVEGKSVGVGAVGHVPAVVVGVVVAPGITICPAQP